LGESKRDRRLLQPKKSDRFSTKDIIAALELIAKHQQ
jgi:hypothetical protein